MAKKTTPEEFIKKLDERWKGEFIALTDYINYDTEMWFEHNCEKCNHHKFKMRPKHLMNENNPRYCPKCQGKYKPTTEEYIQDVDRVHGKGEYTILGEYKTNRIGIPTRHNCEKCNNYTWSPSPTHFVYTNTPTKCPKCAKNAKKNTDDFKNDVYNLYKDEYIVIGEYTTSDKKILMKHNICGCVWEPTPNNFLTGKSHCPFCSDRSTCVKIITEYLEEHNILFKREKKFNTCKNIKELPFDFYIKELSLLIEFDGKQHFDPNSFNRTQEEFKEQVYRDHLKNQWCKNNNITLLRIPYTEKDNIELILENFINNMIEILSGYDLYYQKDGKETIQGIYNENI